ncbi:MAG: hypothetical protein SF182_01705 [Deltaproteobacteria bacterium]|nr:hypothetical protein [Deltaproteobacteria bacterium]
MRTLTAAALLALLITTPAAALVVEATTPSPYAYAGWVYEGDTKQLVVTYTLTDGLTPAIPDLVEWFIRVKETEALLTSGSVAPPSHVVPIPVPPAANRILTGWPEMHTITVVAYYAGQPKPLVREYEVMDIPGFVTTSSGVLVTPTAAKPTRTPLK